MKNLHPHSLIALDDLVSLRSQLKSDSKRVVFTNGVFDIIHPGHVTYLDEAKSQGDVLIVGLNSDSSVRMLDKGTHRPIQSEMARAHVLGALKPVDFVVLFEEQTPIELIKAIMPDVLVKGGDYSIEEIVGAKEVMANGGEVKQLQFVEGYSTSAIEQKIRNSS